MDIFNNYQQRYQSTQAGRTFTIQEYLELCKSDPVAYANSLQNEC